MYEPIYVAFCDNVLTNYVGNFFAEPCGHHCYGGSGNLGQQPLTVSLPVLIKKETEVFLDYLQSWLRRDL